MNTGLSDERHPELSLGKPDFFLGCVVTNHKRHEREVMPQYFKLRKKIAAGARFVINQIGYDTRKDDELLRWLDASSWQSRCSQTSTCCHAEQRARFTGARFRA